MNPRILLRITAGVLLLFAAGHTAGFLAFRPPTAEGLAVLHAMNSVHFTVGRSTYTYGNFYRGFGFFIGLFDLFTAWLTWMLALWSTETPRQASTIAWGLCIVQVVSLALSLIYFSAGPVILSALAAVLFGVAAAMLRRSA